MISNKNKEKYSRQISLDQVGISGQLKITNSSVLVIGAGGLGCPVLTYLASAGVGSIGIIDFDVVNLSNLPRQVLFSEDDIGQNKAEVAGKVLKGRTPTLNLDVFTQKLTAENANYFVSKFDVVVDCTDNFGTRYLVNDTCVKENKCWVYGSIHSFEAQVSVFNWNNGPVYRDLFPENPSKELAPNCNEIGVIAPLTGIVGSFMAMEVLKVIIDTGKPLSGKLWLYNGLNSQTQLVKFGKNSGSPIKKTVEQNIKIQEIDFVKFDELRNLGETQVIDLRNDWESPSFEKYSDLNIPIEKLELRLDEIDVTKTLILCCQKGIRSRKAVEILAKHNIKKAVSLANGIEEYFNYGKN